MKGDKCINRPWGECCMSHNCKELKYICYICENVVKVKDYIEHLGKHYSDQSLYLTFFMCLVNKHFSCYRFRNAKRCLCIYFHRYRYGHT